MSKARLLVTAAVVAAGAASFATGASALTYSYSGVSVPYGVTGGISGKTSAGSFSDSSVYVGQIKLNGTPPAFVYCLDVVNDLANSDTMTLGTLTAGTVPHADASLTAFQIQQIGALAYNGSLLITGSNTAKDIASAATQLAIWSVEYGPYNPPNNNVALTGGSGVNGEGNILASVLSDVSTFLSNVATNTSSWLNAQTYTVTLYNPTNQNSQDLGISAAPSFALTTPLPGALPLFFSGLVGLGFLGWSKKRKGSAAAAA